MIGRKNGRFIKGHIPKTKGKTWEEIYGIDKTKIMKSKLIGKHPSEKTKEKMRQRMLNKPIKYWLGKKMSLEQKTK